MTLREALDIYYLAHPQFTPWYDVPSPILKKTLRSHDISHVLFGCPTTMLGELRVQFWNTFGCVVPKSLRDIWDSLKDSNTRALVFQPGVLKFFLTHIPQALQVRKAAGQMTKKWRFFEEEAYLDMTVGNIRRDFNIRLIE